MAEFSLFLPCLMIAWPEGFWSGVFTSLAATFILFFIGWMIRGGRTILRMYRRFTLSGTWVGTCKLPHYPEGTVAIEVYRLKTLGDHVTFQFFNYRSDVTQILRYVGAGICRGQLFSAFYYIPIPNRSESGVFAVRKIGETLKGSYAQYDLRSGEQFVVSLEDFYLLRKEMSFWKRVKIRLGRPPFASYEEAKIVYDEALSENRWIEGDKPAAPGLAVHSMDEVHAAAPTADSREK